MRIPCKKLVSEAVMPRRGSSLSAGYDLTAITRTFDEAHKTWIYGTGLAMAIPDGHVGLLFPRSSVYKKSLVLSNCVGVIDADYRGEIKILFRQAGEGPIYEVGERVAQIVIIPIPQVSFAETGYLDATERDTGGLGSTGA